MRVGIVLTDLDGTSAPWHYFATLIEKLHNDSDITPVGIYSRGSTDRFPDSLELVEEPDTLLPSWHQLAERHDIDLFHLNALPKFGLYPSARSPRPVVATCHGTGELHDIEMLPRRMWPTRRHRYQRVIFDRLGKYSLDMVFTVSDYVRHVLSSIGYDPDKMQTTYEAVDDAFYDLPEQDRPRIAPDQYILHASNNAPKKNLPTLLEALGNLPEDLKLVITGRDWEPELAEAVQRLGLEDRVQFTGYIPQKQLIALHDHADCFVFPSLHESFGLPNVEAMARGTPLVTTDRAAIPEIVGDAALTVEDPLDPSALADAVSCLLDNQEKATELVDRGRRRAQRFAWERHIRTMETAYRAVCR